MCSINHAVGTGSAGEPPLPGMAGTLLKPTVPEGSQAPPSQAGLAAESDLRRAGLLSLARGPPRERP